MQTVAGTALVSVVASIFLAGARPRRQPSISILLFSFPHFFIRNRRPVHGSRRSRHAHGFRPLARERTRIVMWERSQT
jgi:hypothetical protein